MSSKIQTFLLVCVGILLVMLITFQVTQHYDQQQDKSGTECTVDQNHMDVPLPSSTTLP